MSDANQLIMKQAVAEELQTEVNRLTSLLNKVLQISQLYVPKEELLAVTDNLRNTGANNNS